RTPGETLLRSAVDRSKRAGGHPTFAPDCRATPEPAGLVIANNDLERLAEAGGQLGRVVRSEHGRLGRLRLGMAWRYASRAGSARDKDEGRPVHVTLADGDDVTNLELDWRTRRDLMRFDSDNVQHAGEPRR